MSNIIPRHGKFKVNGQHNGLPAQIKYSEAIHLNRKLEKIKKNISNSTERYQIFINVMNWNKQICSYTVWVK